MGALTSAYQHKLDAIHDLQLALYARRTNTAADEILINPTLMALNNEAINLKGAIVADDSPVLAGPSPADATALQNAIAAAEDAIGKNAAIDTLANAAAVLIGSIKTP